MLRRGDWVRVRSETEILATLDARGRRNGMPFMPEMLQHCGKVIRVLARAEKTCDTITKTGGRRMRQMLHLDTRCDGSGHGGCHASCLLYWHEAWVEPVQQGATPTTSGPSGELRARLSADACRDTADGVRYACQATEMLGASEPLHWWDMRQYWRDWRAGEASLGRMIRVGAIALFNMIQRKRGGRQVPRFPVTNLTKTPTLELGLQPQQLVRIKSAKEIASTLDVEQKNRGMRFDPAEGVPYCGGTYKVEKRVERLIDERSGRMVEMKNPCLILEGVVCTGDYSDRRRFCPRAITHYWREIWLEPVDATGKPVTPS
jgi:hypothetical protein